MSTTVRNFAFSALSALACAFSLPAQCYESQTGAALGTGDDTVFAIQPLGFAFPFNGTTYSDVHISTNGLLYLSNAGAPAPGGSGCCSGTTAALVGGSPTIAPYWTDLNVLAGTGMVLFNNTLPGKAVITWQNTYEFGDTTPFSVQCQLMASGEILFAYDGRCAARTAGDFLVGMSEGGGATVPATNNWSLTGSSATTTNFELFNNTALPFDLAGQTLQMVPTSPGYVWIPAACAGSNLAYGSGCYNVSNSVYSLITSPAAASAALSGTAVTFSPTGSGYVLNAGGTYVAPTGAATVLTLTDDSETTTPALASPFNYPGGSANALVVGSNGYVAVATGNSTAYTVDVGVMLNNPQTAWYSKHDYNPAAVGSGMVKFEQVGNITYITWDGVYNYSGTTAADANFMQFQFNRATGAVTIAWQSLSTSTQTLPLGEPTLVGFSPGGSSINAGSINLATGLPVLVGTLQQSALAMTAAGNPISTPGMGSSVAFTLANIPEFVPTSGFYVGLHIISLGQMPVPGLDLGFLGAPGCPLLITNLDLTVSLVGVSSSMVSTLNLPAGLPLGVQLFSQGAALFTPNSLPNGLNAFGAETSNGIASTIGVW